MKAQSLMIMLAMSLLCLLLPGFAHTQIDSTRYDSASKAAMDRGLAYADQGKYDLAIMEYNQARKALKKDGFINYEMAFAHYQMENLAVARKYARIASEEASEHGVQGCILNATILTRQEKPARAVRTVEKGLKRFGNYYLLYYNLGVAAYEAGDYDKASLAFQNAIRQRLDHAESHLGLARVCSAQERVVQAFFPLHFFLLLQPKHELAPKLIERINDFNNQLIDSHSVVRVTKELKQHYPLDDQMRILDLTYKAFYQSRHLIDSNQNGNPYASFLEFFFSEASKITFHASDDLFINYYIPFFGAISKQGYMEVCYVYMYQSTFPDAEKWIKEHYDTLDALFSWLDEEAPKLNGLENEKSPEIKNK
jgi:Tfp pilus assembly protein PilF